MSQNKKPRYIISSDNIGLLGNFNDFNFLWKEYFDNRLLDGVEVIASIPSFRLNKFINQLGKHNYPVFSLHGQTGYEDNDSFFIKIYMTFLNFVIINTDYLLKNLYQKKILLHAPTVKNNLNLIIKSPSPHIIIENHINSDQSIDQVIGLVKYLRQHQVKVSGLIDIFHYIGCQPIDTLKKNWSYYLDKIYGYLNLIDDHNQKIFTMIHLPIGSRQSDSLPIDLMTDAMLKEFANKIIPLVEVVTFENQQPQVGLLFSTKSMLIEQRKRNKRVFDRLIKSGIIIK